MEMKKGEVSESLIRFVHDLSKSYSIFVNAISFGNIYNYYRYPIDPVGGHMLYPGILAMQV